MVGSDGAVHVWELATAKDVLTFHAHLGGIAALAWNRDGTRLASLGKDGLAKIWDVARGKVLFTLRAPVENFPVLADGGVLAWSTDGKQLVVGRPGGKIEFWDTVTGAEIRRQILKPGGVVVMALDGTKVASTNRLGGYGETIYVWDTTSGNELAHLRDPASVRVPFAATH